MIQRQIPSRLLSSEFAEVTVILTVWKRNRLEEQLTSLFAQTEKPYQVWVYQCGNYVNIESVLKRYPEIEFVHSTVNFKYFGRFSLAQFIRSKYVWILDDDVIPSRGWLANSRLKCEVENAIISSAGRIIPDGDYLPERMQNVKQYFFGDVPANLVYNFCREDTEVDFGCNSWLFKTDWIKAFWQISPYTLETAEDIHLSATCKLKLGIRTIVPQQTDEQTTGNLNVLYGRDAFASWMKPGFQASREGVIRYFIEQMGWQPLLWSKNVFTFEPGRRSGVEKAVLQPTGS
ncbi:glycosyltransferase [Spirosoma arcticum]